MLYHLCKYLFNSAKLAPGIHRYPGKFQAERGVGYVDSKYTLPEPRDSKSQKH